MLHYKNTFLSFLNHNKYWIVAIIGVLIVGVLDENSFYKRVQNNLQIASLRDQISEYKDQYEYAEGQLRELRRNPKAITKIARERYFMKADDEDIFVLSTELPQTEAAPASDAAPLTPDTASKPATQAPQTTTNTPHP